LDNPRSYCTLESQGSYFVRGKIKKVLSHKIPALIVEHESLFSSLTFTTISDFIGSTCFHNKTHFGDPVVRGGWGGRTAKLISPKFSPSFTGKGIFKFRCSKPAETMTLLLLFWGSICGCTSADKPTMAIRKHMFRDFSHCIQVNARTILQSRPQPLLSASFRIQFSFTALTVSTGD